MSKKNEQISVGTFVVLSKNTHFLWKGKEKNLKFSFQLNHPKISGLNQIMPKYHSVILIGSALKWILKI